MKAGLPILSSLVLQPAMGLAVDGQGPSGSSVEKVISMLGDMAASCKKEKHEEEVAFAKFATFCDGGEGSLKKSIEDQSMTIDSLTAENGELETDITELGDAIKDLEALIAKSAKDQKAAVEQRKKDHAAFVAESKDYSESLDALDRAMSTLQKQQYDRPASAVLLQLSNHKDIPEKARQILATFVAMGGDDSDAAPEANAYEGQSGGIIDMLKKLEDDFRAKLGQCEKEEMNGKAAHEMVVQDLVDTIANSEKASSDKAATKSRKEEKVALNKKELEETTASKAEDEHTLSNLDTECKEKKLSFDEKQQLRADEIAAIEKATEIMASPDAAGNSEKHFNLAQVAASSTALPQLRSSNIRHKVGDFLRAEGARLHSQKIAVLAQNVATGPFDKVKKMIESMITRLLEEAKEEADKEGFCNTEIGKSKITRSKLSEDISGLEAAIDEGKATIMELTDSIAKLAQELNDLDKFMKEAGELRGEEKKKNALTIKDAKAGVAATQAATKVLQKFYEKAAQATGFVQAQVASKEEGIKMGTDEWNALANPAFEGTVDKGHKAGMQTFGKAYTGQQEASGGVLAMLEVILSDFANLQADTEAAEAESQKAFEDFMTESNKNKAVKSKQSDMQTRDKAKTESRVREDTAYLKSTQDELLAAGRYYDKLVPQCVDKGMTFEERAAAREAEIASLEEALNILSGETLDVA